MRCYRMRTIKKLLFHARSIIDAQSMCNAKIKLKLFINRLNGNFPGFPVCGFHGEILRWFYLMWAKEKFTLSINGNSAICNNSTWVNNKPARVIRLNFCGFLLALETTYCSSDNYWSIKCQPCCLTNFSAQYSQY